MGLWAMTHIPNSPTAVVKTDGFSSPVTPPLIIASQLIGSRFRMVQPQMWSQMCIRSVKVRCNVCSMAMAKLVLSHILCTDMFLRWPLDIAKHGGLWLCCNDLILAEADNVTIFLGLLPVVHCRRFCRSVVAQMFAAFTPSAHKATTAEKELQPPAWKPATTPPLAPSTTTMTRSLATLQAAHQQINRTLYGGSRIEGG